MCQHFALGNVNSSVRLTDALQVCFLSLSGGLFECGICLLLSIPVTVLALGIVMYRTLSSTARYSGVIVKLGFLSGL